MPQVLAQFQDTTKKFNREVREGREEVCGAGILTKKEKDAKTKRENHG